MNYNSRRELLDRLHDLTVKATKIDDNVSRLLSLAQEEWTVSSDPEKTYRNLRDLAHSLIYARMEGSGVEGQLKTAYAFLEVAEYE